MTLTELETAGLVCARWGNHVIGGTSILDAGGIEVFQQAFAITDTGAGFQVRISPVKAHRKKVERMFVGYAEAVQAVIDVYRQRGMIKP